MNNLAKSKLSSSKRDILLYLTIIVFSCATTFLSAQNREGASLKELAARHNLLIGAATDLNHNDLNEEKLIISEFSILSNENCLKPYVTQPSKGEYDFKQSDLFVGFCKKNKIIAKGHKLIAKNSFLPSWMIDPSLTGEELRKILVDHIETVMGRYKQGSSYGEIKYWDVLNEVISDKCAFEKIGKNSDGDYLYWELAFQTAHSVDPNCVLIWNEYNTETDLTRAYKLYETIKRLKSRGIPIDGVGFQCHIGLGGSPVPDYVKLAELFQKFADIDVYIAITELDVSDRLNQVDIYKKLMQLCLDQPKCISWSTWNVVDKYSWRRISINNESRAPLLFDDNYKPKPSYYGVMDILKPDNVNDKKRILPHK